VLCHLAAAGNAGAVAGRARRTPELPAANAAVTIRSALILISRIVLQTALRYVAASSPAVSVRAMHNRRHVLQPNSNAVTCKCIETADSLLFDNRERKSQMKTKNILSSARVWSLRP
jgi:hypothetical protein